MTKLINVTPHKLNIHNEDGNVMEVEPSGVVARVVMTSEVVNSVDGIPVYKTVFGDLDIPEPREGVLYVASLIVAAHAARLGRTDVVSPGALIRDDSGQPVGCKGLNLPA